MGAPHVVGITLLQNGDIRIELSIRRASCRDRELRMVIPAHQFDDLAVDCEPIRVDSCIRVVVGFTQFKLLISYEYWYR